MFSLLTGLRTRLERRKGGGANVTNVNVKCKCKVFGVTVFGAPNSPFWIGGEVVDWFVVEGGVTSVGSSCGLTTSRYQFIESLRLGHHQRF